MCGLGWGLVSLWFRVRVRVVGIEVGVYSAEDLVDENPREGSEGSQYQERPLKLFLHLVKQNQRRKIRRNQSFNLR